MTEIRFIDQTMRDERQSTWGTKLRAFEATPALPHVNPGSTPVPHGGGGEPQSHNQRSSA